MDEFIYICICIYKLFYCFLINTSKQLSFILFVYNLTTILLSYIWIAFLSNAFIMLFLWNFSQVEQWQFCDFFLVFVTSWLSGGFLFAIFRHFIKHILFLTYRYLNSHVLSSTRWYTHSIFKITLNYFSIENHITTVGIFQFISVIIIH